MVLLDLADQRSMASPAFAHAARLAETEAAGVGRPTGKTGGETMRVLVNNDTGLEVAVAEGWAGPRRTFACGASDRLVES